MSRDVCVALECIVRYIVYYVLQPDTNILNEYQSLGPAAGDANISYKLRICLHLSQLERTSGKMILDIWQYASLQHHSHVDHC